MRAAGRRGRRSLMRRLSWWFGLVLLSGCGVGQQASILFETSEPEVTEADDTGGAADGSTTADGSGNTGGDGTTLADGTGPVGQDATVEPDIPPPTPCLSDAECNDGNPCTQDSCTPEVGCVNIVPLDACDDGVACTVDTCSPATGCTSTPDDSLCDDGIACTIDMCDLGGCLHTVDNAPCNDGNPCTQEWCDPQAGCKSQFQDAACNDGSPCTNPDWCQAGVCTGNFVMSTGCLYTQTPNVGACNAGALTMPARNAAMARVNEIRAMVGIPPVVYDTTHDSQVQQAALVMAANASLSHTPPKNWWCWTQAAYDGASTSNLHLGMNTDGSLASPAAVVDALAIDMNVE
ncbi:MAG: CAP domain-containing protein, partial [Deltaproteobacteria bacterium]|nr:CAP domain-containing protein [Deltaproteobacteria bacterium]